MVATGVLWMLAWGGEIAVLEDRAFAARTPIFGCTITRCLSAAPPASCCQGHQGGLP